MKYTKAQMATYKNFLASFQLVGANGVASVPSALNGNLMFSVTAPDSKETEIKIGRDGKWETV